VQVTLSRLAVSLLLVACAGVEQGPMVELPVGAEPTPVRSSVPVLLPPPTATSGFATEARMVGVVRDFCIAGVASRAADTELAARVGAIEVADPWRGERFPLREVSRTTWSHPDTPRMYFWLGASEVPGFRECDVLAFDGDRDHLAKVALDVVEGYARDAGFGRAKYDVRALTALRSRGYIERIWDVRGFSAGISEDRGEPGVIGIHVNVHALPIAAGSSGVPR